MSCSASIFAADRWKRKECLYENCLNTDLMIVIFVELQGFAPRKPIPGVIIMLVSHLKGLALKWILKLP